MQKGVEVLRFVIRVHGTIRVPISCSATEKLAKHPLRIGRHFRRTVLNHMREKLGLLGRPAAAGISIGTRCHTACTALGHGIIPHAQHWDMVSHRMHSIGT
eukprot:Polyplicarium_translucidae@DN597_c0_g1_i1.p3